MNKRSVRQISQVLWWVGLAAVAGGIVLSLVPASLSASLPGTLFVGAGLVLLAVNLLLGGELVVGPAVRPFTVRGYVVRGEVTINARLADVRLGDVEKGQVAAMQYGPFGKPDFAVENSVATLRLDHLLNLAGWQVDLADNVLWTISSRSWSGHQQLDLRRLRIERLAARTALGKITVHCPTRGYARIEVRTGMGDIEIHLPDEAAARIQVKRGSLSRLTIRNPRLAALGSRRYATPDYDRADAQVDIHIEAGSGDIMVQ